MERAPIENFISKCNPHTHKYLAPLIRQFIIRLLFIKLNKIEKKYRGLYYFIFINMKWLISFVDKWKRKRENEIFFIIKFLIDLIPLGHIDLPKEYHPIYKHISHLLYLNCMTTNKDKWILKKSKVKILKYWNFFLINIYFWLNFFDLPYEK